MTCIHQEGTPNSTYTNSIWYNQWKVVWKMLYWPDLVAGDGGRTRTAPGISRGLMGCPWLLLSSPPLLSSADDLSFCPSSASSTCKGENWRCFAFQYYQYNPCEIIRVASYFTSNGISDSNYNLFSSLKIPYILVWCPEEYALTRKSWK